MTGLDTNVLVRFFAKDDTKQFNRAQAFLAALTPNAPGFVSLVALAEVTWVLQRRYGMKRVEIARVLEHLLNSPEVVIEGQVAVAQALVQFGRAQSDFSDCLIERCGSVAGCKETVTFDKGAAKMAGMKLL
ncbi:MAG TPA: type II toxin-antitoxin system VapC family toxin [Terracidiphilus sp.]